MFTIRQEMEKRLYSNGLFEDEASQLMEAAIASDEAFAKEMEHRWNDQTTDYSPVLANALWLNIRLFAVKWLKANKPAHWAIGVFES